MRRRLAVVLILATGVFVAGLVTKEYGSVYYGVAIFAPFVVWAYMWQIEEIKVTSWHYRVVNYYFEEEAVSSICKACPYWGLVAVTTVMFVIQNFAKTIYAALLQVLFYIWASIWWLFGLHPVWRRVTYHAVHGTTGYLFWHKRCPYGDDLAQSKVWPILSLGPLAVVAVVFHLGTVQVGEFYSSMSWYYVLLAGYGAMLVVVLLGETWKRTGWLALKWAYGKACPDVKFVQPVAVPAKPSRPSQPPVQAQRS